MKLKRRRKSRPMAQYHQPPVPAPGPFRAQLRHRRSPVREDLLTMPRIHYSLRKLLLGWRSSRPSSDVNHPFTSFRS